MPNPDPAFPSNAFLGRLVTVFRDGQPVALPLQPWSRITGMLFCYCSFARRAALRLGSYRNSRRLPTIDLETI
jgi:hypothetical protein